MKYVRSIILFAVIFAVGYPYALSSPSLSYSIPLPRENATMPINNEILSARSYMFLNASAVTGEEINWSYWTAGSWNAVEANVTLRMMDVGNFTMFQKTFDNLSIGLSGRLWDVVYSNAFDWPAHTGCSIDGGTFIVPYSGIWYIVISDPQVNIQSQSGWSLESVNTMIYYGVNSSNAAFRGGYEVPGEPLNVTVETSTSGNTIRWNPPYLCYNWGIENYLIYREVIYGTEYGPSYNVKVPSTLIGVVYGEERCVSSSYGEFKFVDGISETHYSQTGVTPASDDLIGYYIVAQNTIGKGPSAGTAYYGRPRSITGTDINSNSFYAIIISLAAIIAIAIIIVTMRKKADAAPIPKDASSTKIQKDIVEANEKYCIGCGKLINKEAAYCEACGSKQ